MSNKKLKERKGKILTLDQKNQFLLRLEEAGLTSGLVRKVIDYKGDFFAKAIVKFIKNGVFEPSDSQKRAQKIMGSDNFFGVEDAIKFFGIKPSKKQLAILKEIPYSESLLKKLKNSHILVAFFPFSILNIRKKVLTGLFSADQENSCYDEEPFAKEKGEVGWRLISKFSISSAFHNYYEKQQEFLTEQEEVPSAQIMTYAIMGHYLKTGERLFKTYFVYVSSLSSDGRHVLLGYFNSDGFSIAISWNQDGWGSHIGLASAYKADKYRE